MLASGIEDGAQNYTRFFLGPPRERSIAPSDDAQAQRWKTSRMMRIGNKPGSLVRAIGAFALFDIDVSKIESRPIEGRPWEYAFCLDAIGNADDDPVAGALDNVRTMAETVKVLGKYRTRW